MSKFYDLTIMLYPVMFTEPVRTFNEWQAFINQPANQSSKSSTSQRSG